jgi:hypothetical protein
MNTAGFHEGELATQRRAGVEADAGRLEGMLDPGHLSGGATKFLASQTFAAITARDRLGVLWVSPLSAGAGFLRGEDQLLYISAAPRAGDPLHRVPAGQQIGLTRPTEIARATFTAEMPGCLPPRLRQAHGALGV